MPTLKEIRAERGLTQTAVAAAAGVGTSTVCYVEKGRLIPSQQQARKLAEALGVEPEEVVELARAVEVESRS